MSGSDGRSKLGTLIIVVLKGRNLPNRQKIGKQDPYVICRLGSDAKKTKVDKRGGQSPLWDDELRFEIIRGLNSSSELKISVFNEDSKDPSLIGDTKIDLKQVFKKGEFDEWVPLKYKERYAGEVYLEMTFYSAGKPPVRRPQQESAPAATGLTIQTSHLSRQRPLPAMPGSATAGNFAIASPTSSLPDVRRMDSPKSSPVLSNVSWAGHEAHQSFDKLSLHSHQRRSSMEEYQRQKVPQRPYRLGPTSSSSDTDFSTSSLRYDDGMRLSHREIYASRAQNAHAANLHHQWLGNERSIVPAPPVHAIQPVYRDVPAVQQNMSRSSIDTAPSPVPPPPLPGNKPRLSDESLSSSAHEYTASMTLKEYKRMNSPRAAVEYQYDSDGKRGLPKPPKPEKIPLGISEREWHLINYG